MKKPPIKSRAIALLTSVLAATTSSHAQLVINEVDADQSGTDTAEFIELFDGGAGNTPLDGYVVVLFNGSDDKSYDLAFDLDGFSTDSNGFFVLGSAGVNGAQITLGSNALQNGPDAVALFLGDGVDFPNDSALTTTNLVDVIVYGTNDSDDSGLLSGLGQTVQYNDESTNSISRTPDGSGTIAAVPPSPGAANPTGGGPIGLSLDLSSISEDQSTFITGTVSVGAAVSGDLTVTVVLDDTSEATTFDATIFDGDTSGDFIIDAVNDFWPDGDQTVTVTVSAPTYDPNSTTFTVTDDDTNFLLAINEVYNAVDGNEADANADGNADSNDEFIEIVNLSGGPLDLSGVTISDSSFERHIFPSGTTLAAGCSIIVFAGGDIAEGSTAAFGNAEVQIALSNPSFPGLFLDDTGDVLTLTDSSGSLGVGGELHSLTLPDQSLSVTAESLTTATDLNPASGYVLHTTTPSAGPYSPGTFSDLSATAFCILTDSVTLNILPGTRTEADGFVSAAGTVSIPAALGADLTVWIDSSDLSEIDTDSTSPVTILAGSTSADIDLNFIDDPLVDGTQSVTLTARASGYLNTEVVVDVEDVGDTPVFTDLVINEFDSDQPGSDTMEFIELFNKTSSNQDLDGLIVVLFNGSNDTIYNAIDLTGLTIDADGFLVIGNAAVPNIDVLLGSNGLQNGADAIAIYVGSLADYSNGTSVVGLPGTLVDAVVYDGTDAELQGALDPTGTSVPESGAADSAAARVTDGGPAFSSASFVSQTPTPGETNVLPTNDFSTWAADQVPPVVDGPDGDPDGDGITNLVEYALGLDPNTSSGSPGTLSNGTLTFTKGADAKANGDLVYEIETSTDLGATDPWSANGAAVEGIDDITLDLTTAGGVATEFFARLKVTQVVVN